MKKRKRTQKNKARNEKVLFIASAQSWYTRNEFILSYLNDRYEIVNNFSYKNKKYLLRVLKVFIGYFFIKDKRSYDFIFVGFFAQIIVPFIRLFYKGRIVADYFVSMYDTLCFDRYLIKDSSVFGKIIYKYEKWTLSLVDFLIVDTKQSKKYFMEKFGVLSTKIEVVYVVANKKYFYPREKIESSCFNVFYYGSGQELQGINVILQAAKILSINNRIRFTIVGPVREKYAELVDRLKLKNVDYFDWVEYENLPDHIAKSDICLGGHFGVTNKAKRVIAGKTFQFAAMKKPVILGRNKANKEVFLDGVDCIMVDMGDPEKLAQAIKLLFSDELLRKRIAENIFEKISTINYNINL